MSEPPIRSWLPDDRQGACVIVHGLAEHSGRYLHVGERLAASGYATYAFDLRGHGAAEGFPGKVSGPDDWLEDLDAVLSAVRERESVPLFVIGHSMGTLVSLAHLGERGQQDVTGLVLSGTAVAPGPAILEAMANPDGPVIPPEAVSRDPAIVRAYAEDPLVFNDDVPPECAAAAMMLAARAYETPARISVPSLLLHGTADSICAVEGAHDVLERLAAQDKTLKSYNGLYHEVFNEPERDQVLSDVADWLDAHV